MIAVDGRPETLEERIVYWSLVGTWALWAIGALYIAVPAIGWSLAALIFAQRHGLIGDSEDEAPPLLREQGHEAEHVLELGLAQLLKSFMGWMKGWALIAVFVYIGAATRIRTLVLFRASNMLALQTLIIAPIMLVAGALYLPRLEFVSPLAILGGSGPEYFTFQLYGLDVGKVRWLFYSPWSPAAGLVACISLVLALYDRNPLRRTVGIAATLVVCAMAFSRLAYIVVPLVCLLLLALPNLTRPAVYAGAAAITLAMLPFTDGIMDLITGLQDDFQNARADSSRVRSWLQSIALHRWWNEAPIWGHGVVERGPHLVAFMMIGTHHTWNGLLFVKGAVGFAGLAVPMAWSFLECLAKAQSDRAARAALGVLLVLFCYSFGENMETLIYLYWPGMILVGIAARRRFVPPYKPMLGGFPA